MDDSSILEVGLAVAAAMAVPAAPRLEVLAALDVLDDQGSWWPASICARELDAEGRVTRVRVTFDDWASKYDAWIDVALDGSRRLAVLGLHTFLRYPTATEMAARAGGVSRYLALCCASVSGWLCSMSTRRNESGALRGLWMRRQRR